LDAPFEEKRNGAGWVQPRGSVVFIWEKRSIQEGKGQTIRRGGSSTEERGPTASRGAGGKNAVARGGRRGEDRSKKKENRKAEMTGKSQDKNVSKP